LEHVLFFEQKLINKLVKGGNLGLIPKNPKHVSYLLNIFVVSRDFKRLTMNREFLGFLGLILGPVPSGSLPSLTKLTLPTLGYL
jgi:hypothetical protein